MQKSKSIKQRKAYLLAVDPSLTVSGWALFCIAAAKPCAVGTISPPGPEHSLPKRLRELQKLVGKLYDTLELQAGDVLVCEGPAPLVRNPQSAIKVEGVRGIFEALARERGFHVPGRINPRTVQSELLGMKGKQLPRAVVKEVARKTAIALHGNELSRLYQTDLFDDKDYSQDVIDAILIGVVAVSRVNLARQSGIGLEEAMLASSHSGRIMRNRSSGGRASAWSENDLRKAKMGR